MNPDELERRSTAIFGKNWQTEFARHSGVDARTVRRWKAGDREIPSWVPAILHAWETLRLLGKDW